MIGADRHGHLRRQELGGVNNETIPRIHVNHRHIGADCILRDFLLVSPLSAGSIFENHFQNSLSGEFVADLLISIPVFWHGRSTTSAETRSRNG